MSSLERQFFFDMEFGQSARFRILFLSLRWRSQHRTLSATGKIKFLKKRLYLVIDFDSNTHLWKYFSIIYFCCNNCIAPSNREMKIYCLRISGRCCSYFFLLTICHFISKNRIYANFCQACLWINCCISKHVKISFLR